jgi:mono/diheme cytochrome c family protein
MRIEIVTAISLKALLLLAGSAAAQSPQGEVGRAIAERWCAECHVTGTGTQRGVDGVPSFQAIGRDGRFDEAALWARVTNPRHPAMPGFTLSRAEAQSLWVFVRSQAP